MTWTAKAVEHRVVEAADTLMLCPNEHAGGGNGWPDYIPLYPRAMRYRRRPTADALSRMTETWSWINALPGESDRRLLYAWAWQKAKRGRFLSDFAAREGVNSRTLRRTITRICQAIAELLNQRMVAWRHGPVDAVSEIEPELASQTVSSPNHASHFRVSDAIPSNLPDSPDRKRLVQQLLKRNRKRKKKGTEIALDASLLK